MDPELERELEQQMRQLNTVIAEYNDVVAGLTSTLTNTVAYSTRSNDRLSSNTQERKSNTQSVDRIKEAQTKASDVINESAANMKSALGNLRTAAISFTDALFSNKDGFSKYSNAVEKAGEAAFDVGKSFGFLGTVVGAMGLGLGKVLSLAMKQADGLLNGVDSLSKIGAAGSITTNELYSMAHQMGLNSFTLEKFTKAADNARGSMIAFNGNAGDGIKTFAKMTAVTAEQRMAFQRMGVSQEELMKRQADYLNLQTQTGQIIDANAAKDGRLQKASLKYAENIAIISQITGKNAEEAKEQMLQAKAAVNIQIHQRQLDMKIAEAEARGDKDEIERLKKKKLIEDQLLNAAAETGDAQIIAAVQSKIATGNYSKESAVLIRMGIDIDKIQKDNEKRSLKEIENEGVMGKANADLKTEMRKGYEDNVKQFGEALTYSDDLAKKFGATLKMSEWTAKNFNTDFHNANKKAAEAIGKPSEGKGPPKADQDPAQIARNKMTQLEIVAGQKMDDLIKSMNPLLGNTGMLKVFGALVAAAAAALALLAAGKGIMSLVSGIKGLFSGPSKATGLASGAKSLMNRGAATIPGGAATGAAGPKVNREALSKIRKADLLDKKGRMLQGAALQSRLNKLVPEEEKEKEKPTGAFKMAAKSAKDVIKGGAALGTAFGLMGAGLAGAVWIVGKSMPVLADGFKSFNKVDGKNLVGVGLGVAGLGVGILALGSGTILSALGNIGTFITGGKDPLVQAAEMLQKLQTMKLDRKKIEDNGAALFAFAKAMGAIAALGAGSSIAGAIKGVFNGLAGLMGVKMPVEELQEFSKKNINLPKVMINSMALSAFGKAMSSFKGSSLKQAGSAIADATTSFFKSTPPYIEMLKFSLIFVNDKAIKKNAAAFKVFAEAMSAYEGYGSSAGAAGAAIAEATTSFFKSTPPYDQMIKFGELKVNSKAVQKNSIAFKHFAEAMASFKGYGSNIGAIGTALADAASKFFKVRPPLEKAVYFSQLNIDPKKTRINAKAFILFSEAMASYDGGPGLLSAVSTIAGAALNKLFGQDSAMDAFYKFSRLDFGKDVAKNSKAFLDFSSAMGILSGVGGNSPTTVSPVTGDTAPVGPAPTPVAKPTKAEMRGNAGLIYKMARQKGYDHAMSIAFVALAQKETGLNPRQSENLNYSAKRMKEVWPKLTMEQANAMAHNPQAIANFIYGKINGNKGGNDGWTYRGRGFNGITGRGIYAKVGSKLGIDLVGNPDALYDPKLAANAMFAFFEDHPLTKGVKGARTQEDANRLLTDANGGVKRGFSTRSKFGQENFARVQQFAADWNAAGLKAQVGGLFSGPRTGYPVELHGTEMIIPLDPNSVIAKMASIPKDDIMNVNTVIKKHGSTGKYSSKPGNNTPGVTKDMVKALGIKFDRVIDTIHGTDHINKKIMRHSSS